MATKTAGLADYERVAAAIRTAIANGQLAPGERLPGNRALAQQHKVSLPTLQKAVGMLQREGWVVAQVAVGVFVSDNPPTKISEPVDLQALGRTVSELQVVVEELRERVERLEGS